MDFSHRLIILIAAVFFPFPWCGQGLCHEATVWPKSPPSAQSLVHDPDYPPITESEWNNLVDAVTSGASSSIRVMRATVGLERLSTLRAVDSLTILWLDAGIIDDQGLAEIAKNCPNLETLRVRFSSISDTGAACLTKLKKLRVLNLPHSRLSRAGIEHLQELPHLELLRIGGSRIDDQAVMEISLLPNLESLHLIGPKLTEKSLEALARAPNLTCFYLDGCSIGEKGWQMLRQAKPELHIHLDQPHPDQPHPDQPQPDQPQPTR